MALYWKRESATIKRSLNTREVESLLLQPVPAGAEPGAGELQFRGTVEGHRFLIVPQRGGRSCARPIVEGYFIARAGVTEVAYVIRPMWLPVAMLAIAGASWLIVAGYQVIAAGVPVMTVLVQYPEWMFIAIAVALFSLLYCVDARHAGQALRSRLSQFSECESADRMLDGVPQQAR